MTSDTCGPTSRRQFALYDHDSSSWRMWPDIGLWGSIEYSQTWPASGMTRSGAAYELPMSAPRIGVSGSLLLPTPTTEPETGNGHARNLGKEVQLLPTPRSQNGEERNSNIWERPLSQPQNLENALARVPSVATLMPTPGATDGTKGGPNQRGSSGDLMLPSAVLDL